MLFFGSVMTIVNGCVSDQPAVSSSPSVSPPLIAKAETVFILSDANGSSIYQDIEANRISEQDLQSLATTIFSLDGQLELAVDDPSQAERLNVGVNVGCYRFMLRSETSYIGGCIKRNNWHINAHLRDICNNYDIRNFHLVVWWEGRSPQFGIYEPNSGLCKTTRGVFTAIRDAIAEVLRYVLPAAVAAAFANALALIVVSVFGLSFA